MHPPATAGAMDSSPYTADAGGIGASVLQHHNHANRDGVFVDSAFTKVAVPGMKLDTTLNPTIVGNQYSQPLYVTSGPGGAGTFYVVTESNNVYAIDETTGAQVWTQNLGPAAASTGAGCGNISPLGITSTPVIDLTRRKMYLDNVLATGTGGTIKTHMIHALSIDDGSEATGWPIDASTLTSGAFTFDPVPQNQRGALVIVGDTVYIPYGGHFGDCADKGTPYRGWVVGIPLDNPAGVKSWATGAARAGIRGPGGLASDGTQVFASSGNGGEGAEKAGTAYQQQDAILRFQAGPVFSGQTTDYFSPNNWITLDNEDLDLCGSGVLLVDVPGATPSQLAVALGKDGKAYVVDRTNLGGIGPATGTPPVAVKAVSSSTINGAPAWYATTNAVYVVFVVDGGAQSGLGCPAGQSGDLVALQLTATSPPTINVAWCQNSHGSGSPAVTVAGTDTLVWTPGATGDGKLHAFDGTTGTPVYTSTETMTLTHWVPPIAVNGRIIVGGNNSLYAFK